VAGTVPVAGAVIGGGSGHALTGEGGGDLLVAGTGQVHGEDAPYYWGSFKVDLELVRAGARRRLRRVRVRPEVSDAIPVRRSPTQPPAGLGVRPDCVGSTITDLPRPGRPSPGPQAEQDGERGFEMGERRGRNAAEGPRQRSLVGHLHQAAEGGRAIGTAGG
jgi:hypothetical protein